jgi:hypothetical protein
MCTTGPGDPFDDYWRKLCKLVGVDYDQLPIVETTIGTQAIRASYNGGLVAVRRNSGIFERTEEFFRRLVAAGLMPWTADGPFFRTGTRFLGGAATAFWGTSQAAFSLAAVAGRHSVRQLPETYNVPVPFLEQLTTSHSRQWVHIHYHWMFDGAEDADPIINGKLNLPAGTAEWLKARLPLKR